MTERKPPGISQDTWLEKLIRDARERGEFDNLPGAGKPIPDLQEAHDELWWVKQLLKREQLEVLPETLGLRKELEDVVARIRKAGSEKTVRRLVAAVNVKIAEANATATSGPATDIAMLDADAIVAQWRKLKK